MIEIFSKTSSSVTGILIPFLLTATFFILVGVRLTTSNSMQDRRLAWLMMSFGAAFPFILSVIVLRPPLTVRAPAFAAAEFDLGLLGIIALAAALAVILPSMWLMKQRALEADERTWIKRFFLTRFFQLCLFNALAWFGFVMTYVRQSYLYCIVAAGVALIGCAMLYPKPESTRDPAHP